MGLLEMEQRSEMGTVFLIAYYGIVIVAPIITVDFILYFYDFALLASKQAWNKRALRPHISRPQNRRKKSVHKY